MTADELLEKNRHDTHAASLTFDATLDVYLENHGLQATLYLHARCRYAELGGRLTFDSMARIDNGGPNRNEFLFKQTCTTDAGEHIDTWIYRDVAKKPQYLPFDRWAFLPGTSLRQNDLVIPWPTSASLGSPSAQPIPDRAPAQGWPIDYSLSAGTTPGPASCRMWIDSDPSFAVELRIDEPDGGSGARTIFAANWQPINSSTKGAVQRHYIAPGHVELLGYGVTTIQKIVPGSVKLTPLNDLAFRREILGTGW